MITETEQVFKYFEKICSIPHGSGNMKAISEFCAKFAEENGLEAVRDDAYNVVIYKPGTSGYENAEPIILQGHIDMVCQKTEDTVIDFEKDGLEVFKDGDFIKAKGTTLGADNGIAVSMIMAVLASKTLAHPPIEAVFTTDEEIGLLGAQALDPALLKGRKMINLDSEESEVLTVSCAGGSDFKSLLPISRENKRGTKVIFEIKGLKGGHSGADIDKGRVNANILAGRILNHISKQIPFDIIKIDGGTKDNAIPFCCKAEIVTENPTEFIREANDYFSVVQTEIHSREENCALCVKAEEDGSFEVLNPESRDKLMYILLSTPNGILEMSMEIAGLVETSLNLGILQTGEKEILMQYALRSNKESALTALEEKLRGFAEYNNCRVEISGCYVPWEFKEFSPLRELYKTEFRKKFGRDIHVAALHAGLESAVFSEKIKGLDCISVGPDMFDVHTVNEKLSISSTESIFELLCNVLKECK